ncbi:isopenicillin N synthase family oxygenase [bacterium]|nr:isopenicillin N synthase family oxygenase [bacterium]
MDNIPLIDFSHPDSHGGRDDKEISTQIDLACREVGFFTVRGHRIDSAMIHDAYVALRRFFTLPLCEKEKCRLPTGPTRGPDDHTPYGYSALLEENALAYMGQHGRPSDYVEKFSVGRLILNDEEPLPFADGQRGQDLRRLLKNYYSACELLAARVMELLTIPLSLPRDFFTNMINNAEDSMRAHFYPGYTSDFANDQGMGEHTDGTLITLLTQTAPGIQVRTRNGQWIAPEVHGSDIFIVNIGDLMAHWTKGRYLSTQHRVVLSERERQSIVFFKLTNEDEMVRFGNRQMDALFGRQDAAELKTD